MAIAISEVVDRIMRSYFLESGGELKKNAETGVEEIFSKRLEFTVESGQSEEGAASDRKEVSSAMERVREKLAEVGAPYDLSIDRDTNRVIIKMVDPANGEIERQFPEQSLIELSKKLENLAGSVVNTIT
jgi:flagellar protein FlaG